MSLTETRPPYSLARLRAALGKAALKAAFGAAVVVGVLGAGEAQALVVNVNGQNWNVYFFDGTQGGPNAALFQTAANGGRMPWFTNNAASCGSDDNASLNNCLAVQFAKAVGTQLGAGGPTPLRFVWSGMTTNQVGDGVAGNPCTGSGCLRTGQFVTFVSINNINLDTEPQANNARWAYASLVSAPGPLPLFGAAAAFGFSRKLRKRINAGTNFVSSNYNL
jgi:hypothetical protein